MGQLPQPEKAAETAENAAWSHTWLSHHFRVVSAEMHSARAGPFDPWQRARGGRSLSWTMATGRRILFADDDPAIQRALRRLTEKTGFELIAITAGSDVYGAARREKPDLIVLDIHFPDADGRDVLSQLKADPVTASIPVVIWSGRDPESDRRIALDLGAEDYVEKRDVSTLIPKLQRVLLRLRDAG